MIRALMSASLIALIAAQAGAQERMRSDEYTGGSVKPSGDAATQCHDWDVGFDFTSCERMPFPGSAGLEVQSYALADGTRRTFTEDPRATASDYELREAAADAAAGQSPDERSDAAREPRVSGGISQQISDREAEAMPASAVRAPTVAGTSAPTGVPQSDGADEADPEPVSEIVAEEFELPGVVATIPGRAAIMPMAIGHLNRIETPFADPMVRTAAGPDALQLIFDGQFVYVSLTQPVTLFIHERGHPDPAVVVSLVPSRIAPRQVKMTVPPPVLKLVEAQRARAQTPATSAAAPAASEPRANSRGISRTAEGRVGRSLTSDIQRWASGRLPAGYARGTLEGYSAQALCGQVAGVTFSLRQGAMIYSNDYIIIRGMAETRRSRVELQETNCARHPETLAVAFAPRTQISADHPADFFVLIRRPQAAVKSAR